MKLADFIGMFVVLVVAFWFARETYHLFAACRQRMADGLILADELDGPIVDI